jgi:flagella basal body P-ring formation protein FlgA
MQLAVCVGLLAFAVVVNFQQAGKHPQELPAFSVVAARPLAAGKEIERADLDVNVVWTGASPARIGRVQAAIGLTITQAIKQRKPVLWDNIEPATGKKTAAEAKAH